MSIEEEVVAAAEGILQQTPGGLTKEALAPMIAPHLTNKHLPSKKIIEFLRRRPQRFVEGGDGRWRLRAQADAVLLPVDEPLVAGEANGKAALAARLRQGCYVVFDLEAIGADARSPATEIIQIAAWRWIDGRPQEASPWLTFARPSVACLTSGCATRSTAPRSCAASGTTAASGSGSGSIGSKTSSTCLTWRRSWSG